MPEPEHLHTAVEAAFNAGDVDGLVALYEPDAVLVTADGNRAEGLEAIRAIWAALTSLGGSMTVSTRHAVRNGDLALLRNDYKVTFDGGAFGGSTAEIARRQSDGTWRYVIDMPGGAD